MIYTINKIARPKLEEVYASAMNDLDSFFEIGWTHNRPHIFLVPDRETIDALKERKTEDWIVGWAVNRDIYLLDDQNFEKESNHTYSDKEYFALIKHELAHCFLNIISHSSKKPVWLLEGISVYLSGQNALKPKPGKFEKFIDFFDEGGAGIYAESGFAVMYLVETYWKEKLLTLLKGTKESESKEKFAELFKSIYGFDLAYENFKVL